MRWRPIVVCFGVVCFGGCAHQSASPAAAAVASGFDRAWDAVSSGEQQSARQDGYVIERAGDTTVRVAREEPSGGLTSELSDASVTERVKTRLGVDKHPRIQVASSDGVVKLSGRAASRDEAIRAVRDALATDGVIVVDSELEYPGVSAGANREHF